MNPSTKRQIEDLFHDMIMPFLSEEIAFVSERDAQEGINHLASLVGALQAESIYNPVEGN